MENISTIHYITMETPSPAIYAQAVGTAITLRKDLNIPVHYYGIYAPGNQEQMQKIQSFETELGNYGIPSRFYPANPYTSRDVVGKIRVHIAALQIIRDVRRALVRHPGVILSRGPRASSLAFFAKKNSHYTVDLRSHSGSEREAAGFLRSTGFLRWYFYRKEWFILKHANAVLCVSTPLANYVRQLDSHMPPCYIVPSCLSIPQTEQLEQLEAVPVRAPDSEKLVLVYVGTVSLWNRLEPIFVLFNYIRLLVPSATFLCLTPDTENAVSAFERAHIPEHVYEIDSVPNANMMEFLRQRADIGVLLRDDSMINRVASPIKTGEYLAAGLPVIATDNIGDVSALLRDEDVGFVLPSLEPSSWNVDFLGRFVNDVLCNRTMYRERAVATARRFFVRRNYLDVYREVFLV